MAFQDVLPDPNNSITAGGSTGGTAGVGFASVNLESDRKISRSRTNSGRLITRGIAGHKWNIKINYNPLTRDEFEIVNSFLMQKQGGLIPFYVSLPQYRTPRNSNFATHAASNNMRIDSSGGYSAGTTILLLDGANFTISSGAQADGAPSPGDLFTITDSADSNHTKAYMVVRCETPGDAEPTGTSVGDNHVRIHINPPLARSVANNAELVFHNPLIKVVLAKDMQSYSLNTNNLYALSLDLEETQ